MSDPMRKTKEGASHIPIVHIGGVPLSVGQESTLWVALQGFWAEMAKGGNPLGDDEHGRAMVAGYCARAQEVSELWTAADRARGEVGRRPA